MNRFSFVLSLIVCAFVLLVDGCYGGPCSTKGAEKTDRGACECPTGTRLEQTKPTDPGACVSLDADIDETLASDGSASRGDGTNGSTDAGSPSTDGDGAFAGGPPGDAASATFAVVEVQPAENGTLTDASMPIRVTFNRAPQASTIAAGSFLVTRGGQPVAGTVSVDGATAVFTPAAPWPLGARYQVELKPTIQDQQGAALASFAFDLAMRDGLWTAKSLYGAYSEPPKLAMAPSGVAALVWTFRPADTNPPRVFASRLEGGSWDTPTMISSSDQQWFHSRLAIAINGRAQVAAAWNHADDTWLATFSTRWSTERSVQRSYSMAPDLAVTDSGRVHVVYTMDGSVEQFAAAVENASLEGTPYVVSEGSFTDSRQSPQIALLGTGLVVGWLNESSGSVGAEVFGVNVAGTVSSRQDSVLARDTRASELTLMSDPIRQTAIALWQQEDSDWSNIWSAHIVAGDLWGASVVLSDRTSSAGKPEVAIDCAGRATAVWQQEVAGRTRIFAARLIPNTGWETPSVISDLTLPAPAVLPTVAMEPDGNAIAAWIQLDSSGTGDLYAARYVLETGWAPSSRVLPTPSQRAITTIKPTLGADGQGRALVAWLEGPEIWVGRFE